MKIERIDKPEGTELENVVTTLINETTKKVDAILEELKEKLAEKGVEFHRFSLAIGKISSSADENKIESGAFVTKADIHIAADFEDLRLIGVAFAETLMHTSNSALLVTAMIDHLLSDKKLKEKFRSITKLYEMKKTINEIMGVGMREAEMFAGNCDDFFKDNRTKKKKNNSAKTEDSSKTETDTTESQDGKTEQGT